MNWLVIVNPKAGRGGDTAERTRAAMTAVGAEGDIVETDSAEHLTAVVHEGIAEGRSKFVAVGGDGTVNLVADALLRHEHDQPPVLGVLPAGTGCDLVRVFGIPQSIEQSASHLVGDETYLIDAAHISGPWGERYFLNIAQAGIGAASARTADRLSSLGKARYQAAFWATLPKFRGATTRLEVGKRSYHGPAIAVIFANGQFFAGGMNVAPKATFISGEFDIQVFAAKKRHALSLFPRVRLGVHLRHPLVKRFKGPEFSLTTDESWPVEADGEFLGHTPLTGRVVPGAIALKI